MDPHSFIARAEAQRWLGIAEKLLMGHDLVGSKTFAIRARDSDPRLEAADQILAIADTLLAAEKRVVGNNGAQQPDYYAILQLVRFVQDTDHIASQYRRLAVMLNPHQNRFPYSDQAFQLVNDAWAVLSNPMRKSMYDSELDFAPQQQMNTIGFNLEQHHHQQHHQQHQQQQQQHNFFSINHMGAGHEQELPEPQPFQTRVQQSHQQQQLQQHNFLSQPSPVRQEQLFHHREQEQLFQPPVQPFQVTSPPHQQTRQPPQGQPFQVASPPHPQTRQPSQPPPSQVQPFQVASPPHQQTRQPPQPPPPQVPPFQVASPPHQQSRQPPQAQPQVQPFQITSPPHQQTRHTPQPQPPPPQVQPFHVSSPPQQQTRHTPQPQPPPSLVQPFQVSSPPHQQTRQLPQHSQQQQPRIQSPSPPPPAAASQSPFSWSQAPPPAQPQPPPPQSRPQPQPPPQSWPQPQPQPQLQQHQQHLQPHPHSELPQTQLKQEQRQPQTLPHQQPPQAQPQPQPQSQQKQPQLQPQQQQEESAEQIADPDPDPDPFPSPINSGNDMRDEEEIERETDSAAEEVDDSPTFWTSCPYCYYMYEYPKVYAECTLRCDHCQRAFQAVPIPSPPPIAEGQDAYFCCWGYFPLGVSMSHLEKNKTTKPKWTPFSPFYDASGNVQNHLNASAAPKPNPFVNKSSGPRISNDDVNNNLDGPKENLSVDKSSPKENLFVTKSSGPPVESQKENLFVKKSLGPRVYFDDVDDIDDDVFMGLSESSDTSDGEWDGTRKKNKKKMKKGLKPQHENRGQVLAIRARDVSVSVDTPTPVSVTVPVPAEGTKKVGGVNPRRQSTRVGKEMGKLDLNVEFNNNEGEEGGARVNSGNRDEDNIEGNGFFEGLDEFFSSLPILSVVNEEKVKAA